MGKKIRRAKYVSKGQRINTALSVPKTYLEKMEDKVAAWESGQNPWITIKNPVPTPDKLFIKVRANALWGRADKKQVVDPKTFIDELEAA